ncbi:MAG TPA: orotidine-5'-phosphate decarboxylase [Gemmatimonadaceae bacterium]|nr:orotidine-5'-phosphate decarboxylase [Gemmatimonadaceae bacterium]
MSAPAAVPARAVPQPIVALDRGSWTEAAAIVDVLGDGCDFYKVGSELFGGVGPAAVERLAASGKRVFLDLKLHDIPNTVRGAARRASAAGARLLTVHAIGGRAMMEAAVEGAREGGGDAPCDVLAVTVLTSLDPIALEQALGRRVSSVADEVVRLGAIARAAGVAGVVCGGHEAVAVRAAYGESLRILVPGVRPAGAPRHDQARAVTPGEASLAGASWVVLGRAVTGAPEPRAALAAIVREMAQGASPKR